MSSTPVTFPADVVAAVCRHMAEDHAEDALLICRTLGGVPSARQATAVDVDGAGMAFRVLADDGEQTVVVPFARPVAVRVDVRTAVVELHERARAQTERDPGGRAP